MPVPLKAPDADIAVDLAAAFAVAFGRGRYAKSINYDEPPAVKLAAEKLTWAGEVGKK
jgi:hypothetical protein